MADSKRIRELLEALNTEADLARLFIEELDFEMSRQNILEVLTPKYQPQVEDLKIIAELGEFKIILCRIKRLLKGDEREIFNQIANRYSHSLVVFTSPDFSEWHFTSLKYIELEKQKLERKIRPFRRIVVGKTERLRTAAERIALLEVSDSDSPLVIHNRCNQAFDVEAVTRDFYRDFVHYYKLLRDEVKRTNKITQEKADLFTQNLFNRLFFLYYIQKKRLLNENPYYLYDNLKLCLKDKVNYYQEFLIPVFKKLSNPKYSNGRFNNIPFLNGGLFEYEDTEEEVIIPNEIFKVIFSDLLERYNFTVREDTEFEQEVAIDPEMLGTIFEQLILNLEHQEFKDIPDPRRSTGSYYTPKFIVAFMVKHSLLNYLSANNINKNLLRRLVFNLDVDGFAEDELTGIREALLKVKIVDPGVGSGAFAVGILLKMVEIVKAIDSNMECIVRDDACIDMVNALQKTEQKDYRYHLKRQIIENNIYGVDIQRRAVNLANLRLWLSLIVDLEVEDIKDIPPLPNLDFHIIEGDSLISKVGDYPFDIEKKVKLDTQGADLLDNFVKLKRDYEELPTKEAKDKAKVKIERAKKDLVRWFFRMKIKEAEQELARLESQLELFAEYKSQAELPFKEIIKKEIQKLQGHLNNVDSLCNLFNWGLDFFEIISMKEGFDIVIGNPPYGVKVPTTVKDEFRLGSKDSYGLFTSLALKILRPGGTLSFIMSDTWQTIRTHKELRDQLLSQTDVQYLISVPNDTFAATVNPGVYSFIKRFKPEEGGNNWILAADFSPLSIEKGDVEAAFELLMEHKGFDESKDGDTIWSDRDMAIFAYRQKLITRFSNHSFFIASPKLFGLMRDVGNKKHREFELGEVDKEPDTYLVEFNGKELELVKLGDVAEVKQGLATGDNDYYLRQSRERIKGVGKNYPMVDFDLVLTEDDLERIVNDEELRKRVIEKGICKERGKDPERYFGRRYFVPYDKGGASDIEEGWLPNYYVPTDYFIDWSEEAVRRMKTLTIVERDGRGSNKLCSRFQNADFYFRKGISFSWAGIYCPTFRLNYEGPFDHGSSDILNIAHDIEEVLGLLCSKLTRYLSRIFINHTVNYGIEDVKKILLLTNLNRLKILISQIITKQKQNLRYDYMTNEQIEIDKLVYQMYNLNEDDTKEVENWYFRRYPKLAKVIEEKLKEKRCGKEVNI
ncbi:MAG: N-6 DNA methylase [bacterium]|nr:N-6 DNA methylase [bacterium]